MQNFSLLNEVIIANETFLNTKSNINNSNNQFNQGNNYILISLFDIKINNRSYNKKSKNKSINLI